MMPKTQRDYVGKARTAAVMIYRKGLDHAECHFYTVIQQNKQISLILSSVCPVLSQRPGGGSLGSIFSLVVWGGAFAKREINQFI